MHCEALDVIESDADDDASNWFLRSLGGAGAAYPGILRGHNPHTQRNLNSEPWGQKPSRFLALKNVYFYRV